MIKKLLGLSPSYIDKVAICCIVKDEGHYLHEWIEYHLKIGVSRFFIYDNESKIPIAGTLSPYADKGIVKVEFIAGKGMQQAAYEHCLANYGSTCQWIAFIDSDEFIVPKTLTGNLPEFLTAYENYGGLGLNWLVFGSNGHLEKPSAPQTHSYTKRTLKTNIINNHIKTIVQPKHVKRVPLDPHHFVFKKGKYCVNENFERLTGPRVSHTSNKIQLNHYFLRSLEDFKEKLERGRADNGLPRALELFYELDSEANLVTDENIIELKMLLQENSLAEKTQ
jgi:hypothetical protein